MTVVEDKRFEQVSQVLEDYLEAEGLRKTQERFAILKEIYSRDGHFEVEELFSSMKKKRFRVSRATVYNTMDILLACDLITKHQFGQKIAQYEKSFAYKQHDHLICNECHKVLEFCDPRIHNIQKTVGELLGYDVEHHSLILYGNCNNSECENRPEVDVAGSHSK